MKKLVYSLLMAGLSLVGCTSFDDPVQEKYAAGPSVGIHLTATTDSTFTFTVTPAEGAQYYSYIVVKSSEVQQLDAATLLKVAYSGIVAGEMTETAKAASVTNNMRNKKGEPLCLPNTTYQIYAVAVSDKGITGEIANTSVTTTDGLLPAPRSFKADTENKSVAVTFSEAVARGEGEIVAMYYKEWDITNPVVIDEKELEVSIEGNVVTFATPKTYAGSIIAVSWADGAFVDSFGNKCRALNSGLNMQTGKFAGVYFRNDLVPFDMELMKEAEEEGEEPTGNLTVAPVIGSVFPKWNEFEGVFTLDFDIYRNPSKVKSGDVSVVYSNENSTTTYKLTAEQWNAEGNTLTFSLPAEPAPGDYVSVVVAKGAITDVYGNPCNEFFSEDIWWKYFAMTKEMVIGQFNFSYVSAYDEETYDCGTVTIEEDEEEENGLIIKDLYLKGSVLPGYYDIQSGQIYIYAYYELGIVAGSKQNYGLITYSLSNKTEIAFTVNPDGTMVSTDFGVVACDEAFTSPLGWWEKATTATFTPMATTKAFSFKTANNGKKAVAPMTVGSARVR